MTRRGGAADHARSPFRTSSPVLIGRAEHLAVLRDAVAERPAVVLVEGEAGVGKSRLVAELLAGDLGPVLPLVGHCRRVGEPFSYGAVLEALRGAEGRLAELGNGLNPVTGVLAPLLPEIARHLPGPLPPIGDPRAERHRLFRAVRELLGALGPALLVVEDLQWADDGTRQLLRFIAGDPPAPLATAITYRREDLPTGSPLGAEFRPPPGALFAALAVEPLDVAGVRALTEAIVGEDAVSPAFATRLHERTAGIPFVVEETLRALRDPRARSRRAGSGRAGCSSPSRSPPCSATPWPTGSPRCRRPRSGWSRPPPCSALPPPPSCWARSAVSRRTGCGSPCRTPSRGTSCTRSTAASTASGTRWPARRSTTR
ncbi:AAA family ATPase [Actinokineospora soli]|uniref:AAA family ATPase n=1 Tax=Actinokineospora soli TaxID=1048753 RepID=A0ABW2TNN7_9PSEU